MLDGSVTISRSMPARSIATRVLCSRSANSARVKFNLGSIISVVPSSSGNRLAAEHLVAGRLYMRFVVHPLAEARQLIIHPPTRAALVAERPMLGYAVPRVERQIIAEGELFGRGKFLPRDMHPSRRHEGRELLRPANGSVLDRHPEGV